MASVRAVRPIVWLLSAGIAAASLAQNAGPAPATPPASTREPKLSQDSLEATLAALGASLEVERDLLKNQQELYRQAAADRDAAATRLQQLLSEIDAVAQSPEPAPEDPAANRDKEISDAENRRTDRKSVV